MRAYDQYLSYSGFKCANECMQQYYLNYIMKKRPPMEDQRNTLNGNTLHNLLEEYITIGENNVAWLGENIKRVWNDTLNSCEFITFRHNDDAQELLEKATRWVSVLETLLENSGIDIARCEAELKADTIVQVGKYKVKMGARLDIVYKSEYNNYMILDLKASENRAVMAFDQLVWYSIVLGEYLGDKSQPKGCGYILPGFNELPTYHVPEEAKIALLGRLEKAIDKIKAEEWTPTPEDKQCYWCAVKYCCPVKGKLIPHGSGLIQLGQ